MDKLKRDLAEIIHTKVDHLYPNGPEVVRLILERIQETHNITRKGSETSSWEGDVDRQSGAFTDQEIKDSTAWR